MAIVILKTASADINNNNRDRIFIGDGSDWKDWIKLSI
jgi:hypothetical protein